MNIMFFGINFFSKYISLSKNLVCLMCDFARLINKNYLLKFYKNDKSKARFKFSTYKIFVLFKKCDKSMKNQK